MNKKRHIIEDKFKFLVVEKNMIYNYVVKQGRIAYCFENSFGKFVYWEWSQFNEDGFEIQMKNGEKKKIEMLEHSPSVFQKYLKEHKGIKWFFKDVQNDYWEMIASIVKSEIEQKNELFGLKF